MKVEITVIIAVELFNSIESQDLNELVVSIPDDQIKVFSNIPAYELSGTILGYETTHCEILDDDTEFEAGLNL